jgi:hypothetical protein
MEMRRKNTIKNKLTQMGATMKERNTMMKMLFDLNNYSLVKI